MTDIKRNVTMYIDEILSIMPHRYPMLLVDRVISVGGTNIIAQKNVTVNESIFNGHFPGNPIMPGVLIVESFAQAAVILMRAHVNVNWDQNSVYLTSIENAKFKKHVIPGDVMELRVSLVAHKSILWKMHGEAFVEGQCVAHADFSAVLMKKG